MKTKFYLTGLFILTSLVSMSPISVVANDWWTNRHYVQNIDDDFKSRLGSFGIDKIEFEHVGGDPSEGTDFRIKGTNLILNERLVDALSTPKRPMPTADELIQNLQQSCSQRGSSSADW